MNLAQNPTAMKESNIRQVSMTRRTALIASLAALCIGTNYAMLPLPNIKLMDAIVFTTGLCFGLSNGATVAAITWLVYGILNPLGLSPTILLTVVPCEAIYALAGRLVRRVALGEERSHFKWLERGILFGAVGLFSTLAYDLVTNAVSGLLAYNSVWIGLLTMNVPIPLGIMHEASNFVFFATLTPILLRLLAKGTIQTEIGSGERKVDID